MSPGHFVNTINYFNINILSGPVCWWSWTTCPATVKRRIREFSATMWRIRYLRGAILCPMPSLATLEAGIRSTGSLPLSSARYSNKTRWRVCTVFGPMTIHSTLVAAKWRSSSSRITWCVIIIRRETMSHRWQRITDWIQFVTPFEEPARSFPLFQRTSKELTARISLRLGCQYRAKTSTTRALHGRLWSFWNIRVESPSLTSICSWRTLCSITPFKKIASTTILS